MSRVNLNSNVYISLNKLLMVLNIFICEPIKCYIHVRNAINISKNKNHHLKLCKIGFTYAERPEKNSNKEIWIPSGAKQF